MKEDLFAWSSSLIKYLIVINEREWNKDKFIDYLSRKCSKSNAATPVIILFCPSMIKKIFLVYHVVVKLLIYTRYVLRIINEEETKINIRFNSLEDEII